MIVRRSLKVSLNLANLGKKEKLKALWDEYHRVVNAFLDLLLEGKKLEEGLIRDFPSTLSYRYKQCAKRQAISIFKSWRRREGKKSKPSFNGGIVLDYRFATLEKARDSSFDYWLRLSILDKRNPVLIPVKSYGYLSEYLGSWELQPGGRLLNRDDKWFFELTFEKDVPKKDTEKAKAIDLGFRKLGVTSEGEMIGGNLSLLCEKASRRKQGSKGQKRARDEIKNHINHSLKKVINGTSDVVVEQLKNLKKGKKGKWPKLVNRRFNFWIYGYTLRRIKELCEVVGVQCHTVLPNHTSQICPACGYLSSLNRKGEKFKCLKCSFQQDADYVGALNLLSRFTEEFIVPQVTKTL